MSDGSLITPLRWIQHVPAESCAQVTAFKIYINDSDQSDCFTNMVSELAVDKHKTLKKIINSLKNVNSAQVV